MKLYLKDDDDFRLIQQAEFLASQNIPVVVEHGNLKVETITDYIKSIILLKSNGYITSECYDNYFTEICNSRLKRTCIKGFLKSLITLKHDNAITQEQFEDNPRNLYRKIYNHRLRKKLEDENYQYDVLENQVVMHTGCKYFSATVVEDSTGSRLYVAASDGNLDNNAMNTRVIPFIIREDSPLYPIIAFNYEEFSGGDPKYLSSSYSENDNHISIEKDGECYILSVVKSKSDNSLSNCEVAIIDIGNQHLNNKTYTLVDGIYRTIEKYHTNKELLKEKKM